MDSIHLLARSGPPPHPDITTIPTPPLQRTAIAIIFVLPALSIFMFGLRAYIRFSMRQWGLDDVLCGLALMFVLLFTGPLLMFTKLNYFGWRAKDVPVFDPRPGLWWNFLVQMFYNPVLALVKASVLFFLLRLGGQKPSARYAIYALNVVNAAHAVAVFFTALFQCMPMEANWDFEVRAQPGTRCISNWFHVIASCLTILTDLCILALPFWIFLGLKMPKAAKVVVIGVFFLGSLVAVVGIIRVVDVYHLFLAEPDPNADPYYSITVVYASVEVNLAIITATIPTLRPLFRKWFPNIFGGSSGRRDGHPYYSGTYGSRSRSRGARILHSEDHDVSNVVSLKSMNGARAHQTEVTTASPNTSEEEIMRYHGIMRTTNVQVEYDDRSPRR